MRAGRRFGRKTGYAGTCILLLTWLGGCRHKPVPAPPPAASAPPVTSATVTVITPLPALPQGSAPEVKQAAAPVPTPPPVPEKVHHSRRRKRKMQPPKQEAQVAVTTPPGNAGAAPREPGTAPASATPSLGQLSAGTAISARDRARILAEIEAQEARLSKVSAASDADAVARQQLIKTFLGKARLAVAQNDLDGAETLNTKARVLLNELQEE